MRKIRKKCLIIFIGVFLSLYGADSLNIRKVSTLELGDKVLYSLGVYGNLAYVGAEGGFFIVDITDYNNPDSLKFISVSDSFLVFGIKAKDTLLFVSLRKTSYLSNFTKTIIYSISNPLSPQYLSVIPKGSSDLYVIDTLLYIPSYDSLFIVNIKNPSNPLVINKYKYAYNIKPFGIGIYYTVIYDLNTYMDTINRLLYIASQWKLVCYDVSNPLSIVPLDTISAIKYYPLDPPCEWGVWDISKWGNYIYAVGTEVKGLHPYEYCVDTVVIIDVSQSDNMTKIGGFGTECLWSNLLIKDSVFVLSFDLKTYILPRNPLKPPLVAYYSDENYYGYFYARRTYLTPDLYILGLEGGVGGSLKFSIFHIFSTPVKEIGIKKKEENFLRIEGNKIIYDFDQDVYVLFLSDISGRIIKNFGKITGKGKIKLRNLHPGTYFLILKDKKSYIKKIQIWR